jgi:hypothetical protein
MLECSHQDAEDSPSLPAPGPGTSNASAREAPCAGSSPPILELVAAAATAGRLVERLLAVPRTERLGLLSLDLAYSRHDVARLLALLAEDLLAAPPPAAEERAELALAVALGLPPLPPDGAAGSAGLLPWTAWLLGKAQLRAGHLAAAERSLQRSAGHAAACDDRRHLALVAVALGQLRWQERLPQEALSLFASAGLRFAELGAAPAVSACRAMSGFLLLAEGDLMLARDELRAAYRVLAPRLAPSLAVLLCLANAACETALAGTAAPDFLELARQSAARTPTPALGGCGWWDAVLRPTGLGPDRTDAAVDAARRRALAASAFGDAARLTFDQALRHIARDQSVAARLAPLLTDLGVDRRARRAFGELREEIATLAAIAAAQPADAPRAARELALRLAARDVAALGVGGLPWGLCDLADRLLLQRREGDDPLGSAREG